MISSTKSAMTTAAALMVALLVITTRTAEGQSDCVARLVQCADYLNSTNPAPTCCRAIREVVATQLPCLCNLYNNPSLLGRLNLTQALELPKHCNISSDTTACKASSPNSSPVPPSGVSGGDNSNGVDKSVLSMGMSSLFLLFSTVVMFQ